MVVVEPSHAAIARVALNKLRRLKARSLDRVRLTLRSAFGEHPAGTVLPIDRDLSEYLCNDAIVAVSVLNEKGQSAAAVATQQGKDEVADLLSRK